jgi:type 2 lantibiotic biosynthesis protein LanM
MNLPIEEKKLIAASASFLQERIDGCVRSSCARDKCSSTETNLIDRWKKLTSNGLDHAGFCRRLKLSGTKLDTIAPLLGCVHWNDEAPLPPWIEILEKLADILPTTYEDILKGLPCGILNLDTAVPFQHAWAPWLLICDSLFEEKSCERSRWLSETARASWLRYILKLLSTNFSLCLNSAFDLARIAEQVFDDVPVEAAFPEGSKAHYNSFSRNLLEGGWLEILKRYPVASRLISTTCMQQSSYLAETLENFEKNYDDICATLAHGTVPGIIKNLEAGLSDPHKEGKCVIRFEFENSLTMFYKPRLGRIDALWKELLGWLSRKISGSCEFKTPLHVIGEECTWVENIPNSSLSTKDAAGVFYYKAGAILCMVYLLGGTDFHRENIIACGSNPVLVDVETLLAPLAPDFLDAQPTSGAEKNRSLDSLDDSVLKSMILPRKVLVSDGVFSDFGALSPEDEGLTPALRWLDINTDRMRRVQVEIKAYQATANIPHFDDHQVDASEHVQCITKGFEDAYEVIMKNREELLSESAPLKTRRSLRTRHLIRPTQVYADMIRRLTSPRLLRDGAAFSIESEALARPFLNRTQEDTFTTTWKIFRAEQCSILSLNVPLFEFEADGLSLFDGKDVILRNFFLETALEEVERRILKMSTEDLEFQTTLIEKSFVCNSINADDDT